MMDILTKLTPAETLLFTQESNVSFRELLKFTFMDLVLKKVIVSMPTKKDNGDRGQRKTFNYFVPGKNFWHYQPKSHEMVFLSPFFKNADLKILQRHLIIIGIQNSGGKNRFIRKRLMKSPQLHGYFEESFFYQLFSRVKLTSAGKILQKELNSMLAKLDQELPDLIHTDKRKALEILLQIKGNIFLLKNLDFELLKQIDEEFSAELNVQAGGLDTSFTDLSGLYFFNVYNDSFDQDFSYGDSGDSGGTGCSGGSGCSGCSGCGGCGGCGG